MGQAQTPQQRRANAKFAKTEEKKMGKPESLTKKEKKAKPPVSTAALSESPLPSLTTWVRRLLKNSVEFWISISHAAFLSFLCVDVRMKNLLTAM
jgi:hypothetical protein